MITSIRCKNFQSWSDLSFDIQDGVTLIDGYNHDDETSEGSGKSAILNAMCWCLYGKLPKEAKIDEVIKEGEKNCIVEVFINHHLIDRIYRSRGPNDLAIVDINQKSIKGKDSRETQKIIEDIIGMSFDAFCQTVYFAQNFNKKFVTSTQEDRGKILSEIQELEVFDKARKETMNLIKLGTSKVVGLQHDIEKQDIRLSGNIRAIEQQIEFEKQQKRELKSRIEVAKSHRQQKYESLSKTENEIESYKSLYNEDAVKEMNNDLEKLQLEVDSRKSEIATYEGQKSNMSDSIRMRDQIEKDLESYKYKKDKMTVDQQKLMDFIENPTDICPTCGTDRGKADTSHAKAELEVISNELKSMYDYAFQQANRLNDLPELDSSKIDEKIEDRKTVILQVNEAILKIQDDIKTIEQAGTKADALYQLYKSAKENLDELDNQINELENTKVEKNPMIDVLEDENIVTKECMGQMEILLKENNTRLLRLESLKSGFREVKSYTFNSVLNELTNRANKYLSELFEIPMNLRFTNDNMKIGLSTNIGGVLRGYGLLSGGQQRRVCLAVDLALSDIVSSRTGTSLNLLILDEYFKDLSETSMKKCLSLLERIGRPTILIEHNSIFKSIVDTTFQIELRDGTSRIAA